MIKAQNLVKWFGPKLAVDGVSFEVKRGEVLGFLGPNGAGKSTTMRMITGFLPPSGGTVTIDGHDIMDDGIAARAAVGYLPENAPAYPEMTVQGFLKFVAELHGLRGKARQEAVDKVIDTCFLEPVRHQTIETLSKGYRHRTCFAQSILADPPVLVLDEPTDGLDPNQKHEVRNLIKRMGESKAIIISTHILEEVDAVCSRVIIIDRGKLVFNGRPSELKNRSRQAGSVVVRVRDREAQEVTALVAKLDEVDTCFVMEQDAASALLQVVPKRDAEDKPRPLAASLAATLQKEGVAFDELHTQPGRLDDVFRTITVSETSKEGQAL